MIVRTQPEAISTCAMIGVTCVNTAMCTTAIVRLTLVDIWKGKTHSIILQKTQSHLLKIKTQSWFSSLTEFYFRFSYSQLWFSWRLGADQATSHYWNKQVFEYCVNLPWWVISAECLDPCTQWVGSMIRYQVSSLNNDHQGDMYM